MRYPLRGSDDRSREGASIEKRSPKGKIGEKPNLDSRLTLGPRANLGHWTAAADDATLAKSRGGE